MRLLHIGIAGVALLILAAVFAQADDLTLTDGDTIRGTLLQISDGALVFQAELAGQMVIPVERVRALSTGGPFDVRMRDGSKLRGRFSFADTGLYLAQENGGEAGPLLLDSVQEAHPAERDGAPASPEVRRHGLETGLLTRSGYADYTAPLLRLTLGRELEAYGWDADLLLTTEDIDHTLRYLSGAGELRLGPPSAWRPALGIELERDLDAALDFRAGLRLGLRRGLLDSQRYGRLEGDAGLILEVESFDTDLPWQDAAFDRYRRRRSLRGRLTLQDLLYYDERVRYTEDSLSLRLALSYQRPLTDWASFEEELALYPSLTDFGDLRARSESSVLFPLHTQRLKLKLDLRVDYENEPEFEGLDRWQTGVGASLRWEF